MRLKECADELISLLSEESLKNVPMLVFANKQDLPNAMPVHEVTEKLGLNSMSHRQWFVQSTCATTGDGLYEGLDWLSRTLNKS